MAYTDIFGGELIFPSQISYLSITTAVDITLQWPTEQQITGGNVVADFIDVDATVAALNIDMPSALITGTGNKATFNNVGANTFTVRDSTGGTIQSVAPGETWIIVLRDNTTVAGLWRTFQMGANVAVASASALAGAGIKAIGVLLNQKIDSDIQAATPFTVVDGNRATCQVYTAGAGVANLTAPGTLGNDWFFMLRNSGSGTLNVLPAAGLIDGAASINLDPNDSAFIFTDGTDFFTVGLSSGSTIAFDFVSIPIPGSGDFVLSGANLNRIAYRFTGALTGNRKVVVPTTTQQYWVDNQTTGAFLLEVGTAAQITPPQVAQGESIILYCDATDVVNASTSTSVAFPITIGQGGTGAVTAAQALLNLGAAASARILTAGDGIVGGGDLTADRTFDFDLASIAVAVPDLAADFFVFQDVDNADVNAKALLSTIGLVVEEEGAPLATVASTLNFIGGAVTAAGAGATKTITIPIDSPAGIGDAILRSSGTAWVEAVNVTLSSIGGLTLTQTLQLNSMNINTGVGDAAFFSGFSNIVTVSVSGIVDEFHFAGFDVIEIDGGNLKLFEIAAPIADEAAYGQIWVRNDVPNIMVYRDDTGVDFPFNEVGTFTLDWSVGFTGSNVNTYSYNRIGDLVTFWLVTSNLGTSNAATCGTSDGIPAALRPDTIRYCQGPIVDNASSIVMAQIVVNTDGSLDAFAPDLAGSDPPDYGNDWTASGVKGPVAGQTFTYSITD